MNTNTRRWVPVTLLIVFWVKYFRLWSILIFVKTNININMCSSFVNLKCSDGLHLTQSGNQVVFEEVIRKLRDEGLSVESLPADLPLISDIDPNDPMKVFQ